VLSVTFEIHFADRFLRTYDLPAFKQNSQCVLDIRIRYFRYGIEHTHHGEKNSVEFQSLCLYIDILDYLKCQVQSQLTSLWSIWRILKFKL